MTSRGNTSHHTATQEDQKFSINNRISMVAMENSSKSVDQNRDLGIEDHGQLPPDDEGAFAPRTHSSAVIAR